MQGKKTLINKIQYNMGLLKKNIRDLTVQQEEWEELFPEFWMEHQIPWQKHLLTILRA